MTDQPQTDEDQIRHQWELSDLITRVCGQLKIDTEWVYDKARTLSATSSNSTHAEFAALATECADLQQKAAAAAHELTSAGIGENIYSVKACHEVVFRAHEAYEKAYAASQSEYDTEIRGYLVDAENALLDAVSSIGGAVG
jgi:hypothetical protein